MVFVSHAHEDRDAAYQITQALAEAGLKPWIDVQELGAGDELLKNIAKALADVSYFVIVLTSTALTKPWVLAEMRMALSHEIEHGRPKVILLRLDDCEVPIELKHKVYLDFRGGFDAALKGIAQHIKGVEQKIATPKQTILANMISDADDELWSRLCHGDMDFAKSEAADAIRGLRANELEAVAAIGSAWKGEYKFWEGTLSRIVRNATSLSRGPARRLIAKLGELGVLEEANDLDYSHEDELAWERGELLWVISKAARRSGLFPNLLPPPLPERLSSLLAYEGELDIFSTGWYASKFEEPVLTSPSAVDPVVVVISQHNSPPCTWAFRTTNDEHPLKLENFISHSRLCSAADPLDPFRLITSRKTPEQQDLHFDLSKFDDLGLLN